MKKIIVHVLVVISFIFILQVPFLFPSDELPSPEIVNAAREGIKTFIKDTRIENLHRFGFLNQKEVDEATLGEGFQIFTISPDTLLKDETSQDLHLMAVPTTLWQFLIVTDGKAVSLLTVDYINNKWTAVSIGASRLAKQLSKFIETWPLSKGYHYRLIRVYQATADLIELSQEEKVIGIVPLRSGRIAMGLERKDFDPRDLYYSSNVLTKIRPVVRNNIQTYKSLEE